MKPRKLVGLVGQSIRRNRRDFVLSSIGIVVGISSLLFFTALGSGIKQTVLERIFVVRQLEVVKKTFDIAGVRTNGLFGGKALDDDTVDRLADVDGVAEVYPKMKFTFPSSVRGGKKFLGRNMVAELIADGIPPRLVDDELPGELEFRDWGADISCADGQGCPGGFECSPDSVCEPKSCSAGSTRVCTGQSYCRRATGVCAMPIPVIASPKMLEIYNGSFQTAMGGARGAVASMPKLAETTLVGVHFTGVFGRSFVGEAAHGKRMSHRMELVGFSNKAIDLGATIPIGYVKRLNARFSDHQVNDEYHSIVVKTATNEVVPRVAKRIKDMGFALSDDYEDAQRAGLLIMVLTLVFNFISMVILAIAAVNIMHTFSMVILERRQELGLMRAVGATGGDIRLLVLGEATILGVVGGLAGLAIGWAVVAAADYLFATQVGDFPFKPDSLFVVDWSMLAAGVGVAVAFCWIGSLLPALQASRVDPAKTLSGR